MSNNGDVVWANGASWQRDNSWEQEPKQWWICPLLDDLSATLKELKKFPDFAWVVLNGELVDVPADFRQAYELLPGVVSAYRDLERKYDEVATANVRLRKQLDEWSSSVLHSMPKW